jgi:hypothetical protein
MTHNEYNQALEELNNKASQIRKEISNLVKQYGNELLEKNGYKIGDTITHTDGNKYYIAGVDNIGNTSFSLKLRKFKKDGSVSTQNALSYKYKLRED